MEALNSEASWQWKEPLPLGIRHIFFLLSFLSISLLFSYRPSLFLHWLLGRGLRSEVWGCGGLSRQGPTYPRIKQALLHCSYQARTPVATHVCFLAEYATSQGWMGRCSRLEFRVTAVVPFAISPPLSRRALMGSLLVTQQRLRDLGFQLHDNFVTQEEGLLTEVQSRESVPNTAQHNGVLSTF